MKLAPVLLFVYKRFEHTKQTIEHLKKNNLSNSIEVYVFSDGPKKESDTNEINKIRAYIKSVKGFKSITLFENEANKGLAKSIIEGVSNVLKKNDAVIVLEDDLLVSKDFLNYMNKALDYYKDEKIIWSISGYNLPIKIPKDYEKDIYLSPRGCSWGWATWKDRWESCNWDLKFEDIKRVKKNLIGKNSFNYAGHDMIRMLEDQYNGNIDSWAIRWCYNQFLQKKMTIYPVISKVKNIGLDGSGTHSGKTKAFDSALSSKERSLKFEKITEIDDRIMMNFRRGFERKNFFGEGLFLLKEVGLSNFIHNLKKLTKK